MDDRYGNGYDQREDNETYQEYGTEKKKGSEDNYGKGEVSVGKYHQRRM